MSVYVQPFLIHKREREKRGCVLVQSAFFLSSRVLPVQINNSGNKTQDGDDEKIIFAVHTRVYIIKMREYGRWWLKEKIYRTARLAYKKQRKEVLFSRTEKQ
jgi:hypothetical protein